MTTIKISKIIIYPVKSCQGIELSSSQLAENGLQYDRIWAVTTADGEVLTQRKYPKMVKIQTNIHLNVLGLSTDDSKSCQIPIDVSQNAERINVQVWDDIVVGIDQGSIASEFFSNFLGVECRLVLKDMAHIRQLPEIHTPSQSLFSYTPQGGFFDGFPILILSQASIDEIQTKSPVHVSWKNFRPNFVVEGCAAFEEDNWIKIQMGNVPFYINCRCTRCIMTTVTPDGTLGIEPLKSLMKFRRVDPGEKYFACVGVNAVHESLGSVKVGDDIKICQFGEHDLKGIWNGKRSTKQKVTFSLPLAGLSMQFWSATGILVVSALAFYLIFKQRL